MGTKLLLADDSITIQKVVGIIFAGEDYELAIVDNGDAALAKARETRPDVLLVDAVMPGRTGYEVCEEIRRDPGLRDVPILLLTGAFEPFDEAKARQSGADDFIAKPFESQHLIDKVTTLADLGKQRKSAPAVPEPVAAPAPQPPPLQPALSVVSPAPQPAPSQFTVEVVEGTPDDDLWGAFELEEVADEETAAFGEVSFADEETLVTEVTEEPFSFAEEPETAAQGAGYAPQWEPVGEEAFVLEEEGGGDVFAAPAEEAPVAVEGAGGAFDVIPDEEFGVFREEPAPLFEAVPAEPVDIFAELSEPASGLQTQAAVPPLPAGPEFELQFATEDQYVPVAEAAPVVAPPVAPPVYAATGSELSLSEEQLAALVSRISRDILERIAWEVVPDLAERIIREEIQKIKDGR
ncbi:MAG TPA: response regulator [Geobacteraceae bacterium]